MKNSWILIGWIAMAVISCKQEKEMEDDSILLVNSIDVARTEVIVFPRSEVEKEWSGTSGDSIPGLRTLAGEAIPSQLDDLDGDGNWDELSAVIDFAPNEEKKVVFSAFAKAEQASFPKTTDVHFGVGKAKPNATEVQTYERTGDPRELDSLFLQMEGPAWENDKVGFRIYFDPRNGIDIFGKTTTQPTLAQQGLTTDYHAQEDWGMDILKVGTSLGAGSIAIKYQDSLYRVTGTNGATFKTITEGPVRAIFELHYKDEAIGDRIVDVIHTISIEKGDWFYQSDVVVNGDTEGMELVTGIVDLKPNVGEKIAITNGYSAYPTFGKQSENNDLLGMALIFTTDDLTESEAPKEGAGITQTHLWNLGGGDEFTYYFMSGWEASDAAFTTAEGFTNEVEKAGLTIANPILIQ
ncbi:glycosyl hydrolase [Nonlabens sp. YIK11]|uniref:DUF4861 domain-containing protein n=1 Tax=Nonlabens sp. YIK11 TaxID=1453349 RepID=UPI0006DC60CB|nr:DUF4861 domain-containing protein [Nonlabens sp. YIK11]KQC33804.1 glycosyl hydrolase [Nonlabens sp. YIK11]